jgi:carboxymethylenebutenolidase
MPDTPPLAADQIGIKAVRFPSGVPIPNVTDTSVDPYAPTRPSPVAQVEGLEFLPQTPDRYPGLILLHERWGLTSQIKDLGNRLAREGYTVLVPNLYARQGGMVTARTDVAAALMERMKETDVLQDLTSCCEFLNTQDRVQRGVHGVVGFGMGGTWALRFACHRKRLRAAVAFYGNMVSPPGLLQDLACPVLYHHAGADEHVTKEEVAQLRDGARQFVKRVDILTYDAAPHAFCNETLKDAYRPDAAADAWRATTEFLKTALSTPEK